MVIDIDVLKLVCSKLESANISYMLTGSLAANFYAQPRMTRDLDFVIELLEPDIHKFAQLFKEDFYFENRSILEAIHNQSMFNIIHNGSIYKVDFIIRKRNSYRSTEFKRRQQIDLDGNRIWIVSPEDLIISKLFWANDSLSEMQIKDVRNLFFSIKNLDKEYIQNWVNTLELNTIYEKVMTNG